MARNRFFDVDSRIPGGLALVCLGLVLTVLSFSVHQAWSIERFWPLLVAGFGVLRAAEQPRQIEGWLLLLVGGAVQLSNLGLFALPGREVVRFWPVTVVLVGLWELVSSRSPGTRGEGLAVVLLGSWLQWSYFGAVPIGSYRTWPLVLAAVGGVMAWRGCVARRFR